MAISGTQYVRSTADASGDGSTDTDSSGDNTHAYDTLANWESQNETLTGDLTVECRGTMGRVHVSGWTTTGFTLTIRTNPAESSKADITTGTTDCFRSSASNITLADFELDGQDGTTWGYRDSGSGGTMVVEKCLVRDITRFGIDPQSDATWIIRNNIVYDVTGGTGPVGIRVQTGMTSAAVVTIDNNTVYGSGDIGISCADNDPTYRVRNNIVDGSGTSDFSVGAGTITDGDNNASSDGTAASWMTGESNVHTSENPQYDNEATDPRDLHITLGHANNANLESGAKDLSADATNPFSDDYDGNTRGAGIWDIGATQVTTAAGGRIMSSLARHGGLAGPGGIAGVGGGLAA